MTDTTGPALRTLRPAPAEVIEHGLPHPAADRSALLLFDMLECYRPAIEEAGTAESARQLVDRARSVGVPVFAARADHRADGADLARCIPDCDPSLRPWGAANPVPRRFPHERDTMTPLAELGLRPEDYDVPKHRWSAFHQTHLELSLRTSDRDTLIVAGGSTHIGIASTVYAARDLDLQVVVVRDACHGFTELRDFFLDQVFPRVCSVRTTEQVLDALTATASSTEVN